MPLLVQGAPVFGFGAAIALDPLKTRVSARARSLTFTLEEYD